MKKEIKETIRRHIITQVSKASIHKRVFVSFSSFLGSWNSCPLFLSIHVRFSGSKSCRGWSSVLVILLDSSWYFYLKGIRWSRPWWYVVTSRQNPTKNSAFFEVAALVYRSIWQTIITTQWIIQLAFLAPIQRKVNYPVDNSWTPILTYLRLH